MLISQVTSHSLSFSAKSTTDCKARSGGGGSLTSWQKRQPNSSRSLSFHVSGAMTSLPGCYLQQCHSKHVSGAGGAGDWSLSACTPGVLDPTKVLRVPLSPSLSCQLCIFCDRVMTTSVMTAFEFPHLL